MEVSILMIYCKTVFRNVLVLFYVDTVEFRGKSGR